MGGSSHAARGVGSPAQGTRRPDRGVVVHLPPPRLPPELASGPRGVYLSLSWRRFRRQRSLSGRAAAAIDGPAGTPRGERPALGPLAGFQGRRGDADPRTCMIFSQRCGDGHDRPTAKKCRRLLGVANRLEPVETHAALGALAGRFTLGSRLRQPPPLHVPFAGGHGHSAGDELRPGRQDRLAKRQVHPGAVAPGMVRPRPAPLGRQRHDHPRAAPLDPGVRVGGLQAAARTYLDGRRAAVDVPAGSVLHRLLAPLG